MAVTGPVILYTQPIQSPLSGDTYNVTKGAATVPWEVQASSAQARFPKATITAIVIPRNATAASIFHVDDGSAAGQAVFVNPQTAEVQGTEKPGSGNVGLRITGGHLLMGTDVPDSFGFNLTVGNNVFINLMPDSREEGDRLFAALSDGGVVESTMADMFWGDYWGSLADKFGVKWMINCMTPAVS